MIKNFNGNIAVFENQDTTPIKITDVSVNNLPLADKALLDSGIVVNNKQELNKVLEDYCS